MREVGGQTLPCVFVHKYTLLPGTWYVYTVPVVFYSARKEGAARIRHICPLLCKALAARLVLIWVSCSITKNHGIIILPATYSCNLVHCLVPSTIYLVCIPVPVVVYIHVFPLLLDTCREPTHQQQAVVGVLCTPAGLESPAGELRPYAISIANQCITAFAGTLRSAKAVWACATSQQLATGKNKKWIRFYHSSASYPTAVRILWAGF